MEGIDVKIMVAREVLTAICVATFWDTPCNSKAIIRIGTIITPPPRPKRPPINPAMAPRPRYRAYSIDLSHFSWLKLV
jgi:hypothetical protein